MNEACMNEEQFLAATARERTMIYARIRGDSAEGRKATVICKLDPVYENGSDQLSSSAFKPFGNGDIVSFEFRLKENGHRVIVNASRIEDENDLRDICSDWFTMVWEESRILKD